MRKSLVIIKRANGRTSKLLDPILQKMGRTAANMRASRKVLHHPDEEVGNLTNPEVVDNLVKTFDDAYEDKGLNQQLITQ